MLNYDHFQQQKFAIQQGRKKPVSDGLGQVSFAFGQVWVEVQ